MAVSERESGNSPALSWGFGTHLRPHERTLDRYPVPRLLRYGESGHPFYQPPALDNRWSQSVISTCGGGGEWALSGNVYCSLYPCPISSSWNLFHLHPGKRWTAG